MVFGLLSLIGLILIIVGVVRIVRGALVWGIVLILIGLALGGGGFLTR